MSADRGPWSASGEEEAAAADDIADDETTQDSSVVELLVHSDVGQLIGADDAIATPDSELLAKEEGEEAVTSLFARYGEEAGIEAHQGEASIGDSHLGASRDSGHSRGDADADLFSDPSQLRDVWPPQERHGEAASSSAQRETAPSQTRDSRDANRAGDARSKSTTVSEQGSSDELPANVPVQTHVASENRVRERGSEYQAPLELRGDSPEIASPSTEVLIAAPVSDDPPAIGSESGGREPAASPLSAPRTSTEVASANRIQVVPNDVDATSGGDRGRFVQRVAGALRTAEQRDGRIQVRLSPPELGSLRIELTLQQGILHAKMEAETTAARNLLLDNLPGLRDRLAQLEIRVDRFDVDLQQDGGTAFDRQHHPDRSADDSSQAARQHRRPAALRSQIEGRSLDGADVQPAFVSDGVIDVRV
ncbi:MAG TPA: flagellar hook-length control protein FliK [Lacipirellulaceae bacterium]|nr:flagellar hook-length control protein FliK [Lacipirellulaceae bacterium]